MDGESQDRSEAGKSKTEAKPEEVIFSARGDGRDDFAECEGWADFRNLLVLRRRIARRCQVMPD
jgi:hypothetical protein